MNAVRLKELIEYLPRPELIRGEHFDQDIEDMDMVSSRDAEITHFAVNYAETNFAWKFIKALIHNHIPLPPPVDIDDEWLIRTYRFETDPTYKDEAIRGAHMLNKRSMEMTKYALKGMIMSPDNNSTEEIESKINISADVITAFEKIFFNVRDRRDEILFVSQVVYPEGRIVECIDDYIRRESLGNLIMRAGYNNGIADVLHFVGAPSNLLYSLADAETPGKLESLIMANGYLVARNFLINQQRDATGLYNARNLIAAAKQGGAENDTPSEWQGAGTSMKAQMLEIKGAEAQAQQRELLGLEKN